MPLLKRKAFEKSKASEFLRDDDEVFHCEITNEIFKDYEEYCERIILVNSMVWTCEMTGKPNLTYAEALDSEKAARRSLKDFPMELRIPILFLAARTCRTTFADMTEDVFSFVRERYFVGESVEGCLEGDSWTKVHVLSVTAQKQQPGSKEIAPASSYCYELEEAADDEPGQIGTVPHDRVRRRKGVFTRDKCRLFLKQFVEMEGGIVKIKKQALEKYKIGKVMFDTLFTGIPPEFPESRRLSKTGLNSTPASKAQKKPGSATKNASAKKPTPDKKGKQQSMDKFVKKTDKSDESTKAKPNPDAKKSAQALAEKMRKAEEQMKKRKEEEKAMKKEKTARLQAYMKEWQKIKDDLELEDHKIIPKGTPIALDGIPDRLFGDFLAVLEFVHLYAEMLKAKDVFHSGLDVETFRKALVSQEHAGVLSDLVQMLLTTIFSLQEDEVEEYNEGGRIAESTDDEPRGTLGADAGTRAVLLATRASRWTHSYLAAPLSKIHLDATTVTEVLRLHLLSSGATGGSRCSAWRYQQRGGFTPSDDPALSLRRRRPKALRRLARQHFAHLPTDEKLEIIHCLMGQILTYATVRDLIEERLEKHRLLKQEIRILQAAERKREAEFLAAKIKLKKDAAAKKEEGKLTGEAAAAIDRQTSEAIEKLAKEGETKNAQFLKKFQQMHAEGFQYTSYLGSDRAYRRYWVCSGAAGLFVEAGAEPRGNCLDKLVMPAPREEDTLAHVTKLFEEKGGSDKENDSGANSRGNSPKKPLSNLNGLTAKLNGLDTNANLQQMTDLMMCTGDINSCFVHGKGEFRPQWWVYHTEEQIDELIQSLNKRGVRENELKQSLESDKASILDYIKKCPLHALNPLVGGSAPIGSARLRKYQPSLVLAAGTSLHDHLELNLRDYILELEEKIFHGCLGALKVKDREAWRGTIMLKGYDKQADVLTWGPNKQFRDDVHRHNGQRTLLEGMEASEIAENKYRDPGHYLERTESDDEEEREAFSAVRDLASALLQLEQGLHNKYIKRPLGLDDKERKEREAKGKSMEMEALERWEVSLMECTSFAQVLLHLFSLDSSITWSMSILNASCRLCRRRTDPDNMLLCDLCNKGHHLYCLKPKLQKVPEGDWFCSSCKPKEEKSPRKKRKLFSDDDVDDAVNGTNSDSDDISAGVCGSCGSGGRLPISCAHCATRFHPECARPDRSDRTRPSRRYLCASCKNPAREVRRCAAEAMSNIHHYARALDTTVDDTSDSEDSDDNTALVQLKSGRSRRSKEKPEAHDTSRDRKPSRKSKEEMNTSSRRSRASGPHTPLTNGHTNGTESGGRKRVARHSDSHPEALQELLRDVIKHKDSWAFRDPVDAQDVPDYLDIISTPMDFSTISSGLSSRRYAGDAAVLSDIALVFKNCFTYNQDSHPVAKSGYRLEKYIIKRCSELGLPSLPSTDPDPDQPPPKKQKTH